MKTIYHREHGPATVSDSEATQILLNDAAQWGAGAWPKVTVRFKDGREFDTSPGTAERNLAADPQSWEIVATESSNLDPLDLDKSAAEKR